MKSLKTYLIASFVILTTASCTKVIDLNVGNVTGQLVIEGNITNVLGTQTVKLSQNVPFTSTNTYPPVTGASIVITDSRGGTYPLSETQPGTYTVNSLAGRSGTTYNLTVISNGSTYTASSQMPSLVTLDSIGTKPNEFTNSKNSKEIVVHFTDRAGVPNQYRFIISVNGIQTKDVVAFNDNFSDGKVIALDLSPSDINIFSGSTVTVEMQCIDMNMYSYWFTLMQQGSPGAGVAPSNPPTNITPATLGYFSAHTTQIKTIVVK